MKVNYRAIAMFEEDWIFSPPVLNIRRESSTLLV